MVGINTPILYMGKLRHREIKSFVLGHTVKSMVEQGLQSGEFAASKPMLLCRLKLSPLRIQHLNSLFHEIKIVHFFPLIKIVEILQAIFEHSWVGIMLILHTSRKFIKKSFVGFAFLIMRSFFPQ